MMRLRTRFPPNVQTGASELGARGTCCCGGGSGRDGGGGGSRWDLVRGRTRALARIAERCCEELVQVQGLELSDFRVAANLNLVTVVEILHGDRICQRAIDKRFQDPVSGDIVQDHNVINGRDDGCANTTVVVRRWAEDVHVDVFGLSEQVVAARCFGSAFATRRRDLGRQGSCQ